MTAVGRNACLALALAIFAARLFTGIIYENDEATTYLVLKHTPSLVIEQANPAGASVRQSFTVIDSDENELAYQGLYTFMMQWAFELLALCVALAYAWHRLRPTR